MENKIITIGRQFGSGGREIGKKAAETLQIGYYDKELLGIAAKESGLSTDFLESYDEKSTGSFLYSLVMGQSNMFFKNNANTSVEQLASNAQRDAVYHAAEKGNSVIVGRCADYILKDDPDTVHAFIYAPYEVRVRIIKEKHGITEEAAKKLVKKMDQVRNSYYTFYAGKGWNRKEGKDVLLNRAKFGIDGCVDILEAMARNRMQEQTQS